MLTPTKQVSFQFTSDGVSTQLTQDLTLAPVGLDLAGRFPSGVVDVLVTNSAGVVAVTSAVLVGTSVQIQFPAAPPQFDVNAALYIYAVSLYLLF